jgi:hypothetical protein
MIHLGAQILTEWLSLPRRIMCFLAFHKMHQIAWGERDEIVQCPHCKSTAAIDHVTRKVIVWSERK